MESASRRYPSFSSTLLDEIYRSIDEEEEESIPSGTKSRNACFEDDDERRRACLVQEWIENKAAAASTARGSLNLNIKPKPIRTCVYQHDKQRIVYGQAADSQAKSKFTKTKSKALKILKHPISPGGRLATFLNSLFTNNNKPNSRKSTCSSASPSCLTNITPSSTNGFNPHNNQQNKLNLKYDNNNVSENLFKNYQNKVEKESDDDGSSSDSSSDLFELHNISAHMYRDELPVYETTQLDTKPLFI
ncbi:putative protein BIG GRAIN 1 [Helianthus annuus]|uniref:Uncharacterized protein n=1 Tax=Helianthus annuus TaxID=4232 RepID=A0A251S3V6_HELAN|nr:putative protein BIG GRAIN 1 [Helianthus annuus]KAJ0572509.1 putative protein BIG GRAIN 1 [Helianthus annuus]KAJ0739875.1 putative protein BIG GRAIN 1 [Helianthus annuus]KAJ0910647.1 putative protein BIG GRAIN 1 [Helianthus annuus]